MWLGLSLDSVDWTPQSLGYDFSPLYTSIPHSSLKLRLAKIIHQAFYTKTGERKFEFVVVKNGYAYFVKHDINAKHKYSDTDVINMLNFLIDNIFVQLGDQVFQQSIGIPMGTNCAPLLADLFLYSYESEFMQNLQKHGTKKQCVSFNFTFRYIDDVLSLNNSQLSDYIDVIYPP